MPLKIELKPGERAVLNGVVIEGASDGRTEFVILNRATIMRERHIISEENANTPVKRLYFSLQMLYIEPTQRETFRPMFDRYTADLQNTLTLPTLKFALTQIVECADQDNYYEALKLCRAMMETEERLFEYGRQLKANTLRDQSDMPEVPPEIDFAAMAARMKAEAGEA